MANSAQYAVEFTGENNQLKQSMAESTKLVEISSKQWARFIVDAFKAGFRGITGLVRDFTSMISDQQAKLVALVGRSGYMDSPISDLQEMDYIAKKTGTSFENLDYTMRNVGRSISQAVSGRGTAGGALKRMGLDARSLAQESPLNQLKAISDAVRKMGNYPELKDDIFSLGIQGGIKQLGVFKQDIKAYSQEFKGLGVGITESDQDKLQKYLAASVKFEAVWEGIKNKITILALPAIASVWEGLEKIIQKGGGVEAFAQRFATAFQNAGKIIASTFEWIEDRMSLMERNSIATDTNAAIKTYKDKMQGYTDQGKSGGKWEVKDQIEARQAARDLLMSFQKAGGKIDQAVLDVLGMSKNFSTSVAGLTSAAAGAAKGVKEAFGPVIDVAKEQAKAAEDLAAKQKELAESISFTISEVKKFTEKEFGGETNRILYTDADGKPMEEAMSKQFENSIKSVYSDLSAMSYGGQVGGSTQIEMSYIADWIQSQKTQGKDTRKADSAFQDMQKFMKDKALSPEQRIQIKLTVKADKGLLVDSEVSVERQKQMLETAIDKMVEEETRASAPSFSQIRNAS